MKLLIGSTNKGKFMDMSEAFADLSLELLQPHHLNISDSPAEEGSTFKENAAEKARFYFKRSNLPTLADDSGLIVEALENELGIHTRRWGAGADATDDEWLTHFLDRMNREENKRARFECCLCYVDSAGNEYYFEGTCNGVITPMQEADYLPGLPIASCFKPDGSDKVYSAMGIEGKNEWSHRGRAMVKFVDFMKQQSLSE